MMHSKIHRSQTWFSMLLLVVAALAACDNTPTQPSSVVPGAFAFVTTTDFSTGSASTVGLCCNYAVHQNVASIHSDAVARSFGGMIYVVNRQGGDNIQMLDPSQGFATVKQFSVGNGSDPHDIIAINARKAYVTRYNETALWVVDPVAGKKLREVDLSGLADADGIPEMDHMAWVGNYVFVSVQRVDRNANWVPVGDSYLAAINTSTDRLVDVDPNTPGVQSIKLAGNNPYTELVVNPANGKLCVGDVGTFGVRDEGIETVNPFTGVTDGIVMPETKLKGDVTDVAFVDANRGYAIVSDANFNNLLLSFDLSGSADPDTVYAPGAFVLPDMEIAPGGRLLVADRTSRTPGIRIFRTDTNAEVTTTPIDVGLPPFDIELAK